MAGALAPAIFMLYALFRRQGIFYSGSPCGIFYSISYFFWAG